MGSRVTPQRPSGQRKKRIEWLLETLQSIMPIIQEAHWMQTRVVAKRWARRARPKLVATWTTLRPIPPARDIGRRANLCFWP